MNLELFSNAEAITRLTPLQQAMLAHTQINGAGAYVGQMSARLRGALDPARIAAAFQRLVERHAALRTAFTSEGVEEPLQIALPAASLDVVTIDLVGRDDAEAHVAAFLAADRARPFALDRPPLMRVTLFRLDAELWRLVLTRHHLIMDGWSANLLLRELDALLAGESLPGVATPFHYFIDRLDRRDDADALAFWTESLAGAGEGTQLLPGERLARGETPAQLREIIRPLDDALIARLQARASAGGFTTQTVFAGAWALLAARYAREKVAQFGVTVSGRPEDAPEAAGSIGLFMDTAPLRLTVDDVAPVDRWLAVVQRTLANVARHPHVGLPALKRIAGLQGDESLFSHILVLEAYGAGGEKCAALSVEDYQFVDQTNFALNIGVVTDEGVHLAAVFDPTRLSPAAIERLLANYETTIAALIDAGATPLGAIDVVGADERLALETMSGRRGRRSAARFVDLPRRLEAAAARHGPAVAVRSGVETVSFDELWRRTGQIAGHLARHGVGCDRLVGVALPRSIGQVVAIVGILRAGGAYVPLDPDDPPARRAAMQADAGFAFVIGADEFAAMTAQSADPPALPDLPPNAAAYALFTSGSTGRPKLALNSQEAIVNRLAWMQASYPIDGADRILQKTASTFDVSVWEFLWPLSEGACLILAEPDAHRDPEAIRDAVARDAITVLHLVPSVARLILAHGGQDGGLDGWAGLRHLILSGEALDPELAASLRRALPTTRLHNLYGPAEAAIDVTAQECDELADGERVPIGRPIDGVSIQLLDDSSRLAPWGAVGEIAIGGVAVGRGYVERPDLTAERFVPDCSSGAGLRLYRTGDLAHWDEAGRLVFHGRSDHQIKLRGQRIELGEIEAALRACAGVADAAVLVVGEGSPEATLTAHLVGADPDEPTEILIDRTRKALRDVLPAAMTPGQWRRHDALPRLASQKIDRRALAARAGAPVAPSVAPRSDEERQLASLWAQVLGRADIGVTTDFFELGGHSLSLVRLANLIRSEFGVALGLAELFDATTVERQLALIVEGWLAAADPETAARMLAEVAEAP